MLYLEGAAQVGRRGRQDAGDRGAQDVLAYICNCLVICQITYDYVYTYIERDVCVYV